MGLFDSLKEAFESDPQKLADWEKDLTELQGKLASASGDEAAKIQAEIDAKTQAIAGLKSKMGVETPVTLPAEVTEPETLPAPEEVLPEPVTPEVPSEPETVTPEVPSEPAPEPVPQPQPVVEAGTYTVQPGDTLSAIGERFGVPFQVIARANGIANPDMINVGQVLRIPPADAPAPEPEPRTYAVRPGDALSSIGREFGVSYTEIARANGIANPDMINVGQVLRIP